METDEILLIVVDAESGGTEDGFQSFVQFKVLVSDLMVHFGTVLPKQHLECVMPQDNTLAIVLIVDTKGRTVLRQDGLIEIHGAEHNEKP